MCWKCAAYVAALALGLWSGWGGCGACDLGPESGGGGGGGF